MLVHNGGLLRFRSRWQKAVSLSSWESELRASVSTGLRALGLQSGLSGLGNSARVTVARDNQGVMDHTARQGLGLAKHVHTRHLWLQAAQDEGRFDVVRSLCHSTASKSCASSSESNTTKTPRHLKFCVPARGAPEPE